MNGKWIGELDGNQILRRDGLPVLSVDSPCPFCGGKLRAATETELEEISDPRAWCAEKAVICDSCHAYADTGYD